MPEECLFCCLVAGKLPADVVRDGPRTLAFRDVNPQAPVHLLVVPKEHHADVAALAAADPEALVEVVATAGEVAAAEGLDGGYRLVANTGQDAGQSVPHAHLHVLGGRSLRWPPG